MRFLWIVLGVGLALFLWQNWATGVTLVFLGRPLFSLPLGVAILGAAGLGSLTVLAIYGLLTLGSPLEPAPPAGRPSAKPRAQTTDARDVLEPDVIEYPQATRRPPPAAGGEEPWDRLEEWEQDWTSR